MISNGPKVALRTSKVIIKHKKKMYGCHRPIQKSHNPKHVAVFGKDIWVKQTPDRRKSASEVEVRAVLSSRHQDSPGRRSWLLYQSSWIGSHASLQSFLRYLVALPCWVKSCWGLCWEDQLSQLQWVCWPAGTAFLSLLFQICKSVSFVACRN